MSVPAKFSSSFRTADVCACRAAHRRSKSRARSARDWRRRRSPASSTDELRRPARAARARRPLPRVTARDPEGGRGDPPLGRARDGPRGEAALPGDTDRRRPGDRRAGFHYDFDSARAFTPEDLRADRGRDGEIVAEGRPVSARECRSAEAVELFTSSGSSSRSSSSTGTEGEPIISFYRQGDFVDLCRGPHVPRTGQIGAFKLLVARGRLLARRRDATRCSSASTAPRSSDAKELDEHLRAPRGGASERDHRSSGAELDLSRSTRWPRARRSSTRRALASTTRWSTTARSSTGATATTR